LFSTAAATPEKPAGLLNGIAPIPSTGTIEDDLVRLATAVAPVSGNGQIAFVAAASEAISLNLKLPRVPVYPILQSSSLAAGTMIAIALPALNQRHRRRTANRCKYPGRGPHGDRTRDQHRRRCAAAINIPDRHRGAEVAVGNHVGIARQARRGLDGGTMIMTGKGRLTPLQRGVFARLQKSQGAHASHR
jgi:hypothetical protein